MWYITSGIIQSVESVKSQTVSYAHSFYASGDVPEDMHTEPMQQQAIQQVYFDGLGRYDRVEDVPELDVFGHRVQNRWMLQKLRGRNLMYDSVAGIIL